LEPIEGFKYIPGYESFYSINKYGKIWGHRSQKFLQPTIMKSGYLNVWLQGIKRSERKHYFVHRLVAQTYIPNPFNLPEVNHKDGNKANCNDWNLEWATHQGNIIHAHKNGLILSHSEDNFFRNWINWSPEQLVEFEKSPYNIPACGPYNCPQDLKARIAKIEAELKAA
jgi:hypothetical protein